MIKALVKRINNNVYTDGAVVAMRKFFRRCNTEVIVKSNKEINKILRSYSGIVVANHPAEADALAILSAVKNRKDVFLIINSSLKQIIPELDRYLIPVYIYNKSIETLEGRIKLKILSWFHKTPKYSREEEHQKNIESINMAIEKVNKGGLVIIFPDGGNKRADWFSGVGHLIHGIKNKENKFVIRAHIEGTSNWDYLRLLPGVGKILPKFKVTFSKPLRMDTIEAENPKMTTTNLENKYWNWIGSKHLWIKLSKHYAWMRVLFLFLVTKPY